MTYYSSIAWSPERLDPLYKDGSVASRNDFVVSCEPEDVDAFLFLREHRLRLSVYSVEKDELVLVSTKSELDLGKAAFAYQTQRRGAHAMLCLPYPTALSLAEELTRELDYSVVHIHSTGRCGSTLLLKALDCFDECQSLSELDAFTALANGSREIDSVRDEASLVSICRTIILLQAFFSLGRQPNKRLLIHKHRSFVIDIAEALHKAVPGSRSIFLYRSMGGFIESWLSLIYAGHSWPFKVGSWTGLDRLYARKFSESGIVDFIKSTLDGDLAAYSGARGTVWLFGGMWIHHMRYAVKLMTATASNEDEDQKGSESGNENSLGSEKGAFFAAMLTYEALMQQRGSVVVELAKQLGLHMPAATATAKEGAAESLAARLDGVYSKNSQSGTIMASVGQKKGGEWAGREATWLSLADERSMQALLDCYVAAGGSIDSPNYIIPGSLGKTGDLPNKEPVQR